MRVSLVVSYEEWLVALSARRRRLPMVEIDKDYFMQSSSHTSSTEGPT